MQFKVEIPEVRRFIEKKPTNNIDAWNDYLQGRFYWSKITRQDMDSALLYFEQAAGNIETFQGDSES